LRSKRTSFIEIEHIIKRAAFAPAQAVLFSSKSFATAVRFLFPVYRLDFICLQVIENVPAANNVKRLSSGWIWKTTSKFYYFLAIARFTSGATKVSMGL
jgi:hypothetical protein